MGEKEYKYNLVSILSFCILLLLFSINLDARETGNLSEAAWTNKDWKLDTSIPEYIRYTTHGTYVHGHLIEIVKTQYSSEEDINL